MVRPPILRAGSLPVSASGDHGVRNKARLIAILLAIHVSLYVGTFAFFRATATEFSLAPASSPQHNLVLFSENTDVHCACRFLFAPLIWWMPGHRWYPDRAEHQQLMLFKDRFRETLILPVESL